MRTGRQARLSDADLLAALRRALAADRSGSPLLLMKYVRRELPGVTKEEFDRVVLDLAARREVVIHYHDFPASLTQEKRDAAVRQGNTYYHAIALPRHRMNASPLFGDDILPGTRLTPVVAGALPVGTIVWPWVESEGRMDGSPLVVVADGILSQLALLPERADGEFPGGAPVDEWGREFVLIHAGSGKMPTKGAARRWADRWVRTHGMGRHGLQPNARDSAPHEEISEYRGFSIEKIQAVQVGYDIARTAGTERPRTRKIGTQYVISIPGGGTKTVSTKRRAHEYIDEYLGPEYEPNASYYVWVMGAGDEPLDEGVAGPHDLGAAKTYARIAATRGVHDRAVSRGRDPTAKSFEVVRRYRAGTGERVV